MPLDTDVKKQIIAEYATTEGDTGSPEVQIALLTQRIRDLTEHAVFYLDPHVCMRCRYRSTELLWQCPHCHDWNTFVEERIAPANDPTEVEA